MDLTNEQAQQLFDAGGFIIITDLPEGSEFGIDGTYHITRRLSGLKFVPPGIHLVSVSSPPSTTSGPSAIPIRTASLRNLAPRERVVLAYEKDSENVSLRTDVIISDDHLRNLDVELAPYPFDGLSAWKSLTTHLNPSIVEDVVGADGRVDGMMTVQGEDEAERAVGASGEGRFHFVEFNLKRSWRDGAVGEEVTRYSKNKSWLLGHVVREQLKNDLFALLGQFQLSFILLLHLSSYSSLVVYKRLLPLFTRSASFVTAPLTHLDGVKDAQPLFTAFIHALTAQLRVLPEGVFETELPELDLFYMDEIESLRSNLSSGLFNPQQGILTAWKDLQSATSRWKWEISDLERASGDDENDEDEDEEGEYAPVVVET